MFKKCCLLLLCSFVFALTMSNLQAQEALKKFEVGGQFSFLWETDKSLDRKVVVPGAGGRFGFNLSKHLGLEAESTLYLERTFTRPPVDTLSFDLPRVISNYNGPAVLTLFGLKAGRRTPKFGFFVKARPGFALFHSIQDCPAGSLDPSQCRTVRPTRLAFDLGAVLEGYLSPRIFIRVDLGDTYLRYGSTHLVFRGSGLPYVNFPVAADNRHRLQLNLGFSARF